MRAFFIDSSNRNRSITFDLISLDPIAIGTIQQPVLQNYTAIAIGQYAGYWNQSTGAIAIGEYAGNTNQGSEAIAIGSVAGEERQNEESIAIGVSSGNFNQGTHSIAIGRNAGHYNQGSESIAIGYQAGQTNQANNSIVLNASGESFVVENSGLYIKPVRSISSYLSNLLMYNPINNEILYSTDPIGPTESINSSLVHIQNKMSDLEAAVNFLTSALDTTDFSLYNELKQIIDTLTGEI